jgi:peptide/nickel transport system permease protein
MLEVMRQDYVTLARAKGNREAIVINKHALRNAMIPVVTVVGVMFGRLIAGAVLTETIFSWPGMGLTLLNASTSGDIPVIMGASLFLGLLSLVAHLVADH